MQRKTPSWTVAGKGRTRAHTQTPGPGEYSIEQTNPIRFYLSTSSRKNLNHSHQIPGPGSYSPFVNENSPKISFAKSLRTSKTHKDPTPGPGEYPFSATFSSGPSYSILGREMKNKESISPGPGAYSPSVNFSLENFPSVRIGKSKREILESRFNGPGPASYSMDFSSLSGPKWKIGSSVRKMFKVSETPGPGLYKIPTAGEGISYSFSPGKRHMDNVKKSETPGPGTYSPTQSENSPRAVIGTSKRDNKLLTTTPGPGTYNPELRKSGQYAVYLEAPKEKMKLLEEVARGLASGPRFSIRKKLPHLKTLITPGPGTYRQDTEVIFEQEPKWSIPVTGRDSEPARAPN